MTSGKLPSEIHVQCYLDGFKSFVRVLNTWSFYSERLVDELNTVPYGYLDLFLVKLRLVMDSGDRTCMHVSAIVYDSGK